VDITKVIGSMCLWWETLEQNGRAKHTAAQ